LINIYQNAVKYSFFGNATKPRTVRTKCRSDNQSFRIEISNYGIGILEQELVSMSIWEEGTRGLLSSDRERMGSGLGLPQIKQIIEAHNGSVEITSNPLTEDIIDGPYLTTLIVNLPYTQSKQRSSS